MKSKLSILGLYNYDDTIFSGLQVPALLSRNILIDYIIMECADLELLYPAFDIMKKLLSSWSIARLHSWEKLLETTQQNYNMIHNYDRYEEWTDAGNRQNAVNSEQTQVGYVGVNNTVQTSKPGYNVSAGNVVTENIHTNGATNSNTSNQGNGTENENTSGTHSGHTYGNIGVTTAAQMLTGERELYKWDVYAAITQEFKNRFCVLVY